MRPHTEDFGRRAMQILRILRTHDPFTVSSLLNTPRKELNMSISNLNLERQLLETDAGQAVYDALVQANVDLRTVSVDLVKEMLRAEYRHRAMLGCPSQRGCLSVVG